MLALDRPFTSPHGPHLDTPGFGWWYLDAVDAEGTGVVLIWSWGLPFVPGTAAAARAGTLTAARERPSINLAAYERGQQVAYRLETLEPREVSGRGGRWRFGASTLSLGRRGARVLVDATIDLGIAGSDDRIRGQVRADLAAVHHDYHDPGPHGWTPLGVSGMAEVAVGDGNGWTLRTRARGYLDRNLSHEPLSALGIDRWYWGRIPLPDGSERIYYLVWPERGSTEAQVAWGLDIDRGGRLTRSRLDVAARGLRLSPFGLSTPRTLELTRDGAPWATAHLGDCLDDGPFYQRYTVRAEAGGGVHHGTAEVVHPAARDGLTRPLVEMAVARHDRRSMWLPLFDGPRHNRWARLASDLLGAPLGGRRPAVVPGGERAA